MPQSIEEKRAKNLAAVLKYRSKGDNMEKARARAREWYHGNKERAKVNRKVWYDANRDKARELTKQWARDNPDKKKCWRLRSTFGISLVQRDEMLTRQGGVCAICGGINTTRKDWNTDHCHATGKIRGILCPPCNLMLGAARDNVDILQKAIDYLRR